MSENIGEYNRSVDIVQANAGRDTLNQPLAGYVPFLSGLWAKIRGQAGMSVVNAGDIDTPINRYSFRVLGYHTSITAGMSVLFSGAYYEIKQVKPDHTNRDYTDLVCEGHG